TGASLSPHSTVGAGGTRTRTEGRSKQSVKPWKSLVAGANAWFRWAEADRPEPDRILHDPFARRFVEHDPRVELIRLGRFLLPPLRRTIDELQTAHCTRHRAIDELVCRAAADGFAQVVTIGPGYDMRPARLSGRAPAVRWTELDHPGTQARKRELAAGLDVAPVARAAIDLMSEPLEGALAAAGVDPRRPVCFVLEGLIHYLSDERLDALLAGMAAAGDRVRAVFSFIRTDMYERRTSTFVGLIKAVRE